MRLFFPIFILILSIGCNKSQEINNSCFKQIDTLKASICIRMKSFYLTNLRRTVKNQHQLESLLEFYNPNMYVLVQEHSLMTHPGYIIWKQDNDQLEIYGMNVGYDSLNYIHTITANDSIRQIITNNGLTKKEGYEFSDKNFISRDYTDGSKYYLFNLASHFHELIICEEQNTELPELETFWVDLGEWILKNNSWQKTDYNYFFNTNK